MKKTICIIAGILFSAVLQTSCSSDDDSKANDDSIVKQEEQQGGPQEEEVIVKPVVEQFVNLDLNRKTYEKE